jgi:alkylhydroperoxidase family enzyme
LHFAASDPFGCRRGLAENARAALLGAQDRERARQSSLYSDRERAALGWTEALTRIAETGAPDSDYEALKSQFSEAEQVQLTLLIGAINTWNRLQVAFRVSHPAEVARAAA